MLVVLIVAGFMLAPLLRSPVQVAAEAAPPAARPVTVEVETRQVQDKVEIPLRVAAGVPVRVGLLPETMAAGPIITALPLKANDPISTGDVLAEVNGEPLIAFDWAFPPYRDLEPGMKGPDVKELQRSLDLMEYRIRPTGIMDSQTQDAIRRLYRNLRYDAPTASSGQIGRPDNPEIAPSKFGTGETATRPAKEGVRLPAQNIVHLPRATGIFKNYTLKVGDRINTETKTLLTLVGGRSKLESVGTGGQMSLLAEGSLIDLSAQGIHRNQWPELTTIGTELEEIEGLGTGYHLAFRVEDSVMGKLVETKLAAAQLVPVDEPETTLAVPALAVYQDSEGKSFILAMDSGIERKVAVSAGSTGAGWVAITPSEELPAGALVVIGGEPSDGTGTH